MRAVVSMIMIGALGKDDARSHRAGHCQEDWLQDNGAKERSEALRSVGLQPSYPVVDLARLPKADARRGYPTPTLLYKGVDIFGMEQPTPPYPEPT